MNKLPEKALFIVSKIIWFICTSRNALVVIVCAVMAGFLPENTFKLTGEIQKGIPAFQPPPFSIPPNVSNATGHWNDEIPFSKMASQLGSAIIIIPIIAILESVAIAKAFCRFSYSQLGVFHVLYFFQLVANLLMQVKRWSPLVSAMFSAPSFNRCRLPAHFLELL